jgi:NADH-quinone oxidoreductase subunit J
MVTSLPLFYLLAAVAVASALGTVLLAHPLWCATSLIVHLLAIAGIFFLQGAEFVGIMQILLYAGAIVVLILFVIMILGLKTPSYLWTEWPFRGLVATLAGVVLITLVVLTGLRSPGEEGNLLTAGRPGASDYGSMAGIGTVLFGKAKVAFEAVSVLLVVAIVAAVALAKKKL